MRVDNVKVYGMEDSFRASKFPMKTDVEMATEDMTEVISGLARSEIGSGHDNFLNGIVVQFDLTFSNKAFVELQRYHFIDFVSSQSTMHMATRMDFRKMCNKYVDPVILDTLEVLRNNYLANKTEENFLRLVYNIPSGFELTARMTTNYRQLKTIYAQRKNHRLPDWKEFCRWLETLPHSEFITREGHDS